MSTNGPRALNLRIASLDPNTPKAKKDCKTCNRRRIRCDRSLPTCQKCGIRELECPGYDLKLKWDQGVASRGRLAGKAVPIFDHVVDLQPPSSTGVNNLDVDDDSSYIVPTTPLIKYEIVDFRGKAIDGTSAHHPITDGSMMLSRPLPVYHTSLPASLSAYPELQDRGMQELVHHYDHNLAATFVWVDSSHNPWRNVILPLSYKEPSLLFSVLALAAEHLSKRAPGDSLQMAKHQGDACKYRDKSLKLLARHLKQEIEGSQAQIHDHGNLKMTSAKAILATMLILCQLEMVHSESMVWKVHLAASHTMIQRWLLTPSSLDISDAENRFLIKETFTINVFAATTSFADDDDALNFEDADDHTLFSDFMTVIHEITRKERMIAAGSLNVSQNLNLLEERLEHARTSTHQLAANYDKLRPKAIRRNFDRIVDIYHYAGLIYTYQALADAALANTAIGPLLDDLLKTLHLLPASGLFAQDLAWPLFIASTECREREHERDWLQQKMEDSGVATGFGSCHQAWVFLQRWWDQEEDASHYARWIEFARARAARGHTFLVF